MGSREGLPSLTVEWHSKSFLHVQSVDHWDSDPHPISHDRNLYRFAYDLTPKHPVCRSTSIGWGKK